jgi:hypothetical protein
MCIFGGIYERLHNVMREGIKILRRIANVFYLQLKISRYYTLAYL